MAGAVGDRTRQPEGGTLMGAGLGRSAAAGSARGTGAAVGGLAGAVLGIAQPRQRGALVDGEGVIRDRRGVDGAGEGTELGRPYGDLPRRRASGSTARREPGLVQGTGP